MTQHLKPGDLFVTVDTIHDQKVTWRINEFGMPQIITREDNADGVS